LKRSEARLLINYREQNGPFRSLEDLKKVQGIEFAKLEAKKDRILFQ
jgi:competence protein ComEA